MASSPITSWQMDGETMKTVTDFIFLGSKITVDGDCSHEIKKTLPPWKESYDQPTQHIKKQRHYFAHKGLLVMAMVFSMLSFKPTFSLSSLTFIKRLLSSSSLSAIRVVSSAYLRLLIFLLAILIPACASSSPAILLMYSAYKLSKQGDNIQL